MVSWLLNMLIREANWPVVYSVTNTLTECGCSSARECEEQLEQHERVFFHPGHSEKPNRRTSSKNLSDDDIIQRIKDFMSSAHPGRDALLPKRTNGFACTCGYACGKKWHLCCDACWSYSGIYFKTLVDLEHEIHTQPIKKVAASSLRRIVCERNPHIWRYVNRL